MPFVHVATGFSCACLVVAVLTAGCTEAEPTPAGAGGATAAATAGSGAAPTSYGDGDCGQCVLVQCAPQVSGCQAEPECVKYLECLLACDEGESGDVEASCEEACPSPAGSAAKTAKAELTACRTLGQGAEACPACDAMPPTEEHPLNNQMCSEPDGPGCSTCLDARCCETEAAFDASPDAQALQDCWVDCVDYACVEETCIPAYDGAAVSAFWEHVGCFLIQCGDDCTGASACELCHSDQCADLEAATYDEVEDFYVGTCINACDGDVRCLEGCATTWPVHFDQLAAFVACGQALCADVC